MTETKRLRRPQQRKRIAGVCAGLADHFGWGVNKVRVAFLVSALLGAGEIAYVILWIVVPRDVGQVDDSVSGQTR